MEFKLKQVQVRKSRSYKAIVLYIEGSKISHFEDRTSLARVSQSMTNARGPTNGSAGNFLPRRIYPKIENFSNLMKIVFNKIYE